MPQLLTTNDLSAQLRMSPKQIRAKARSGDIPTPIRMGGRMRWQSDIIDRFLEGKA